MRLRSHVQTDESSYILYIFTGLSLYGEEFCSSVALLGLLYKENQGSNPPSPLVTIVKKFVLDKLLNNPWLHK